MAYGTGIFDEVPNSPMQSLVRARTPFGIKPRMLAGLAGGLQGYDPNGGFFGNLARSLSGSIGGGMAFDQREQANMQRQAELQRQAEQDAILNQYRAADETRAVAAEGRAAEDQSWQRQDRMNPQPGGYRNEMEFFTKDPAGYAKYRAAGRAPDSADADTGINFTPEALRMTARIFAQTGQTPSLGFGKSATKAREAIINAAAKDWPNVDPVSNKAELDRNRASLTNVSKIYDAASAWEQTAEKNSDVMLALLDKIPDTGTRFGNKLARSAKSQVGDPEMAAFNAARETIKVEYARLLSSPGVGNAVLSDQARKEVEGLISGDLTRAQIKKAIGILRRDAKNRKQAYEGQIKEIRGRLKFNELGTAGPTGGQDVEWIMDPNGNLVRK